MPYKLKISKDEVREELGRLGFTDVSDEVVNTFRKDLLRLIKQDLKSLKAQQESQEEESFSSSKSESTSSFSDSLSHSDRPSKEKLKLPKKYRAWVSTEESGYSDQENSSAPTSLTKASDDSSSFSSQRSSRDIQKKKQQSELSSMASSSTSGSTEKSVELRRRPGMKQRPRSASSSKKKSAALPSEPSNKCDPVTLYHFYKAYWDKFKVPGEDARAALRWNVRTKMVLGGSYP